MDAKKATLPAAALVIGLGSFAVGQQAAKPATDVRAVSLMIEPAPVLTVVIKTPEGPRRRRIYCGGSSKLDGKASPEMDKICTPALAFAKAAADAVRSVKDELAKP